MPPRDDDPDLPRSFGPETPDQNQQDDFWAESCQHCLLGVHSGGICCGPVRSDHHHLHMEEPPCPTDGSGGTGMSTV
ncbi:rCG26766 [Rattus norvegicus]|uniref:RCG26766 n=1 Tax=Rattus norvegicus TaxID=10116 RepID=A6HP42_RAT|nr:rCG26766 [Rattus norvegicus]